MNKIVREQYPVRSLPADLREGLDPKSSVRVVIEQSEPVAGQQKKLRGLMESVRAAQPLDSDPVRRIRKLRDEWDD